MSNWTEQETRAWNAWCELEQRRDMGPPSALHERIVAEYPNVMKRAHRRHQLSAAATSLAVVGVILLAFPLSQNLQDAGDSGPGAAFQEAELPPENRVVGIHELAAPEPGPCAKANSCLPDKGELMTNLNLPTG